MEEFIAKFRDEITGSADGFDRLIFRGSLRRLNYSWWDNQLQAQVARGMEEYLWQNKVLFKYYQQHVKQASDRLKKGVVEAIPTGGIARSYFCATLRWTKKNRRGR